MGYTLAVAALRRVEHDDRGRIVSRTRYVKGDVIEGLSEADVNRLLTAGAITDDSVVEPAAPSAPDTDEGQEDGHDGSEATGDDDGDEDEGGDEDGDDLDDLDYSALQDRAKEAGIAANQSAADLRAALRNQ